MPILQIYTCCGAVRSTWDSQTVPLCGTCRGPMRWTQTRISDPSHFGWATGMKAPAIDFNQTKGRVAPIGAGIPVNSLHDIRRIEREAARAVANGDPGAEPLVFRKYAQDHSNMDVHTLGEAPTQKPSADWLRRNGHRLRELNETLVGHDAEQQGMGPGALEDLASALPVDPA